VYIFSSRNENFYRIGKKIKKKCKSVMAALDRRKKPYVIPEDYEQAWGKKWEKNNFVCITMQLWNFPMPRRKEKRQLVQQ